jgi:hypothetical protein
MPVILTPCTTGTEALFERIDDETGLPNPAAGVLGIPVEAWDDQGRPMVAGRNGLVLVGDFRSNRFAFARLAIATTASAGDPLEPERRPVRDPGENGDQGGEAR